MRGLGIGILVTALLMGVATKEGRPLTDAEIRAKAYELGMVDSDSIKLGDLKGNTPNPQVKATLPPEGTAAPQGTTAPRETTIPEPTQQPQESAAPAAEPGGDGSGEAVTVVIMRGAHSYSVSVQLAEAGLIENASEFDSYLCDNGYGEKVRAGTYRIVPGTSEEQIAKIITGTK